MVNASEFAELSKLCRRSFPGRLDQRVSQIGTLDGTRHQETGFALSWREGRQPRTERLILRRYSDAYTWWSFRDGSKAEREWSVLRWLYGQGLPVPRAYAVGAGHDAPFVLFSRASGRPSTSLGAHVGGLSALLARLHAMTPPEDVRQILPAIEVASQIAGLAEKARERNDTILIDAVEELGACETEERPPCVLHGDPRPVNVRSDARGITALTGWENSARGDPRWDVARTTNSLRIRGSDEQVARFSAAYEEASGWPLADLVFWEALTAVQTWAAWRWMAADETADTPARGPARTEIELWRSIAWINLTRLQYYADRHKRAESQRTQEGAQLSQGSAA